MLVVKIVFVARVDVLGEDSGIVMGFENRVKFELRLKVLEEN